MKKVCIAFMVFALAITMCSCSEIEISGLENYSTYTCSVELTKYLFPHENFASIYEYKEGDYHYWDMGDLAWGYVKAFSYLSYEPEIYEEAKNFCLDSFEFCENHKHESDGYQFNELQCHKIADENGEINVGCDFPQHFNGFGYHDESCTLFFFGYYNGDPQSEEKKLAQDDFSAFMKTVYKEYYDFDK